MYSHLLRSAQDVKNAHLLGAEGRNDRAVSRTELLEIAWGLLDYSNIQYDGVGEGQRNHVVFVNPRLVQEKSVTVGKGNLALSEAKNCTLEALDEEKDEQFVSSENAEILEMLLISDLSSDAIDEEGEKDKSKHNNDKPFIPNFRDIEDDNSLATHGSRPSTTAEINAVINTTFTQLCNVLDAEDDERAVNSLNCEVCERIERAL